MSDSRSLNEASSAFSHPVSSPDGQVPLGEGTGARVCARGWGWRHAGRKNAALSGVDLDIAPGERVLCCLRRRPPYAGLYNLPGGRVEPGESGQNAAERELMEETGVAPQDASLRKMLRTEYFWDDWALLKNMFTRCEIWQSHVGPGCWPDCDMLPLGRIGVRFGQSRQTRFTPDEQKTMLTLWSIFRSPLILGAELPSLDEATLRLLTNRDVLRLNRHSFGARQIVRDDAHAVWVSQDEDGSRYAALFNLSEKPREVSLDLRELEGETFACRELWSGEERTAQETLSCVIEPHGARLFRCTEC